MENQTSQENKGVTIGAVIWLVAGGLLLVNWGQLPPELPLFYSLPAGSEQLLPREWFLAVWGGVGAVMWLNVVLAKTVAKGEALLASYLVWGGVVVQILFLMTLIRIIEVII